MTYEVFEKSRASGTPIEIYKFVYGTGPTDFHLFTDSTRPVTYGGQVYTPVPIDRGKIELNGGRERRDMRITCSSRNPILNLFHVYPPDQAISVTIRAGHADDPDQEFRAVWSGRVIVAKSKSDGTGEIICRHIAAASKQGGLRRNYQLGCPHVLYAGQCKAAKVLTPVTVTGVVSNRVTLALGWNGAVDPGKYVGGLIEWAVDGNQMRRTVLRALDDARTLVLSGPPSGIVVGGTVNAVLGCNHQMTDCLDLHANIANFGGQPWIPTENPVNRNNY